MAPQQRRMLAALSLALALIARPAGARADLPDLLASLPADYDAAALIDVRALRADPAAAPLAAIFQAPEGARTLVLASRGDLDEASARRVVLVELSQDHSIPDLARSMRSPEERIGGMLSVQLPSGLLAARLAPFTFAAMAPARRQDFARWMRALEKPPGEPNAYLKAAAARLGPKSPVVLAIDLGEAVGIVPARSAIYTSTVLADKKVAAETLAGLLTSVRGLTLTITPGEPLRGELRVDFGRSTAGLGDFAGPFLLETLDRAGASVADFEDWTATLQDQAVVLAGPLSEAGLKQIAGLFVMPASSVEPAGPKAESTPAQAAAASKRYYDRVRAVQDELNGMRGALRGRTNASQAIWYNKFADKIDQIPVLDVDPALITFGAEVSKRYRAMAFALNGVNLATAARRGDFDQTAGNFEQIRRQEATYAQGGLLQLQAEIDTLTAEIRKAMTQKFRIEF